MKVTTVNNNITVDLGTTNTKVTLWHGDKPELKKFKTPKSVEDGRTSFELDDLWHDLISAIKQFDSAALKKVKKIAFASFGESGTLLDVKTHERVGHCLAWFDESAQVICDRISVQDKSEIYKITGLPVQAHYSACKIAWLLQYDKSLPSNSPSSREYNDNSIKYLWLLVPDYLVYKMTGQFGTEYSLASRTLCLDLKQKTWSNRAKQIMGIENVDFPKIHKAGEKIGTVTGELSHILAPSCEVTIAGHDHMVGSNSAQLNEKGLLDSTGTTEALMSLVNQPDISDQAEQMSLANGIYTDGKHYTRFTAMPSAGSTIEWFMHTLHLDEDHLMTLLNQSAKDYDSHKILTSRVLVVPHFNGSGAPYKSSNSEGLIYGINRNTTEEQLVFGLFLGLTYEFAVAYDKLFGSFSHDQIRVIGPAINDPLWLQLKADLLRKNVNSVDIAQAVSAGAYVIATGTHNIHAKVTTYLPTKDSDKINYLKKEYTLYKSIYNSLQAASL